MLHKRSERTVKDSNSTDCYPNLAHYVGRLGAHLKAVKILIKTTLGSTIVQTLSSDISIAPPSRERTVRLPSNSLDPWDICKAVCRSPSLQQTQIQEFLYGFYKQDVEHGFQSKLSGHTQLRQGSRIATRVHAEILLADLFSRKKYKFAYGDRYIGCSKGACYCCAAYLDLHHNNFVKPASHNKVILGWRVPEPSLEEDTKGKGQSVLARMAQNMEWKVEQDLMQSLSQPRGRIGWQHLSTNGSSRATSMAPLSRVSNGK